MSSINFKALQIPEIEIAEIGRLLTPTQDRKIYSKDISTQKSNNSIALEIIPSPEHQVLSAEKSNEVDSFDEVDLVRFNWENFEKVDSDFKIKLLHYQLTLVCKELKRVEKITKKTTSKTNCIIVFSILLFIVLIPIALCAILAFIFLHHFSS